jgi:hypothetical protein
MFLGNRARLVRKRDNLTAFCEQIVKKMWEPGRITIVWALHGLLQ